jgi:hypothetical protein
MGNSAERGMNLGIRGKKALVNGASAADRCAWEAATRLLAEVS